MISDQIDKLAEVLLYEGYVLYPYRLSLKNTQRWTFGGLYPPAFCASQKSVESPRLQLECLIVGDENTTLEVELRFLRIVDRKVARLVRPLAVWPDVAEIHVEYVDCLAVGDRQFLSWQEASEQRLVVTSQALRMLLGRPENRSFTLPASHEREPIAGPGGQYIGVIERTQHVLPGTTQITVKRLNEDCFRVTFIARNDTSAGPAALDRSQAVLRSFAAAHAVVQVTGGELVSQIDPPTPWREIVAANENIGTWPVLVGKPGDRSTMLASPIILEDYPQVAPESAAVFCDATEIDEMLALRVMTLTDAEKNQMRALDSRSRELLDHVESLGAKQLLELHGANRDLL